MQAGKKTLNNKQLKNFTIDPCTVNTKHTHTHTHKRARTQSIIYNIYILFHLFILFFLYFAVPRTHANKAFDRGLEHFYICAKDQSHWPRARIWLWPNGQVGAHACIWRIIKHIYWTHKMCTEGRTHTRRTELLLKWAHLETESVTCLLLLFMRSVCDLNYRLCAPIRTDTRVSVLLYCTHPT